MKIFSCRLQKGDGSVYFFDSYVIASSLGGSSDQRTLGRRKSIPQMDGTGVAGKLIKVLGSFCCHKMPQVRKQAVFRCI